MTYVDKYIDNILKYMNGINKQEEIEKIFNNVSDQIIDACIEELNEYYPKSNRYSKLCIFITLFTVILSFILNNKLSIYLLIIPLIMNIRGIIKYSSPVRYNKKLFIEYFRLAGVIHGILFNKCVIDNNNFEGDAESLMENVREYFISKSHDIVNNIYE